MAIHRQIWFGPAERPLAGWLTIPSAGSARGAVLLSPAIGDESRATRRTFRALAEQLADRGLLALRVDVDGVGDSAGSFDDPAPATRWLASIRVAVDHLRDLGFPEIGAVGMRLGGTLLATVAAEPNSPIVDLVLWDPAASGTSFLREGEALYAFGGRPAPAPHPGRIHTPGYHFDEGAVTSLRTLDLARLPVAPSAARLLLLTRADRPFPKRVLGALASDGLVRDVAVAQAELLDVPPTLSNVPEKSLGRVLAWFAQSPLTRGPERFVPAPVEKPAAIPVRPRDRDAATATLVREYSTRFGPNDVYGMVTEPESGGEGRPWLVMVNVALTDHTGPGRQWVDLARQWAAEGFRCVRFDLSGVGESAPHAGAEPGQLWAPGWLEDGPAVVDRLSADGSKVCLIGICSGAYTAFETAMTTHVDAVVGINAIVTLYEAAPGSASYTPKREVARIPFGPLGRLARRRRVLAGGLWRIYRQFAFWQAPMRPVRRLAAAGTTVYIASNAHDLLPFREVAAWWPLRVFRPMRGRLILERHEDLDHPVLTLAGRERAESLLTAFVRERYAAELAAHAAAPRLIEQRRPLPVEAHRLSDRTPA